MHLDEEQVQRVLHGESTLGVGAEVTAHLDGCAECRSRVSAAELEEIRIFGLLSAVDHPPPQVNAESIRVVAGGEGRRWGRLAAGAVLALVVAGAAYAAPGSPLRPMVQRLMELVEPSPRPQTPVLPTHMRVGSAAGIAVAPGTRFTILFSRNQADGVAAVGLIDGEEILVRSVEGEATFTSDVDRLSVDNRGASARFEILIPRRAPSVEIVVGSRRVFLSQTARVITAARADSAGHYLLTLGDPASP